MYCISVWSKLTADFAGFGGLKPSVREKEEGWGGSERDSQWDRLGWEEPRGCYGNPGSTVYIHGMYLVEYCVVWARRSYQRGIYVRQKEREREKCSTWWISDSIFLNYYSLKNE